jgi:hypothetical protein
MVLTKSAVQTIGAAIFLVLIFFAIRLLAIPSAGPSPASLTKTYSNPAWGFTLKMPADFSAYPPNASPNRDATGAPTGQAIVLQNKSGAAVQIVVTKDNREESNSILTSDDISRYFRQRQHRLARTHVHLVVSRCRQDWAVVSSTYSGLAPEQLLQAAFR